MRAPALHLQFFEDARDPAAGAKVTVEKYGVDLALDLAREQRSNELQLRLTRLPEGKGLFWFDATAVSTMWEIARLTGRTALPEPARLIDLGPLEEALAGI